MRHMLSVALVALTLIAFVGCHKSPVGPSGPSSPVATLPVPANPNDFPEYHSDDGKIIIRIKEMRPAPNSTVSVGSSAEIWADVINNSDSTLSVFFFVLDSPEERPGHSSSIFQGGRSYGPHAEDTQALWGYTASVPEEIPFLRIAGDYHEGRDTYSGNKSIVDLALPLHWKFIK